jgi:hypothetical protein
MIISASYKTDIPAFYGQWLINRLEAGYCYVRNPYSGKARRVELTRDAVDAIVFWTKNAGPFMQRFGVVHDLGYPFHVQYTINGYPKEIEPHVVNPARSIEHAKVLTDRFGPDVVVWRYDTILISSLTPVAYHEDNFSKIAEDLSGYTNEVVISFAQTYKKTKINLDKAAVASGFKWEDPPDEIKLDLVRKLARIAATAGIQLTVCAQPEYITQDAKAASCIDIHRLSRIASKEISYPVHGNRPGCACHASVDIGDYDTCPHGCVYCYAVRNQALATSRFKEHDPNSEMLIGRGEAPDDTSQPVQLTLL